MKYCTSYWFAKFFFQSLMVKGKRKFLPHRAGEAIYLLYLAPGLYHLSHQMPQYSQLRRWLPWHSTNIKLFYYTSCNMLIWCNGKHEMSSTPDDLVRHMPARKLQTNLVNEASATPVKILLGQMVWDIVGYSKVNEKSFYLILPNTKKAPIFGKRYMLYFRYCSKALISSLEDCSIQMSKCEFCDKFRLQHNIL